MKVQFSLIVCNHMSCVWDMQFARVNFVRLKKKISHCKKRILFAAILKLTLIGPNYRKMNGQKNCFLKTHSKVKSQSLFCKFLLKTCKKIRAQKNLNTRMFNLFCALILPSKFSPYKIYSTRIKIMFITEIIFFRKFFSGIPNGRNSILTANKIHVTNELRSLIFK